MEIFKIRWNHLCLNFCYCKHGNYHVYFRNYLENCAFLSLEQNVKIDWDLLFIFVLLAIASYGTIMAELTGNL